MQNISFPNLGLNFKINPIALNLPFGIKLHWYGIIIGVGMILAVLITYSLIKEKYENTEFFFDYLLITVPLSIIGARIYYVIFSWDAYKDDFMEVFFIWHGGLAIYGAVIVGIICTYFFTKKRKIPLLWFLDVCAPSCILAQSIGRWGNFVNGEAHGGVTKLPWGMRLGSSEALVHPTFLYESLWNFIGFLIMYFVILKRKKADGYAAAFYFAWYGAGRFFIEGLRTDSLYIGSVRVSQLVAAVSVVIGIALAVYITKKSRDAAKNESQM